MSELTNGIFRGASNRVTQTGLDMFYCALAGAAAGAVAGKIVGNRIAAKVTATAFKAVTAAAAALGIGTVVAMVNTGPVDNPGRLALINIAAVSLSGIATVVITKVSVHTVCAIAGGIIGAFSGAALSLWYRG